MGLFKEIGSSFSELKSNVEDLKDKLNIVQDEAKKAQKIGKQIQTKVSEFQFGIEGNLAKINEITEKYEQSNNE
ncbi:MAG: hypothetical protein LBI13_10945 [Streptococcaceae bacterium]|jgi:chromosome segregation ATPase|nr:hypothetical protein [Streptococcaceae bacterium]